MGKKISQLPSLAIMTNFFGVIVTRGIRRTKPRHAFLVGKCSQQRHTISKAPTQLFLRPDRPETGEGIQPKTKMSRSIKTYEFLGLDIYVAKLPFKDMTLNYIPTIIDI